MGRKKRKNRSLDGRENDQEQIFESKKAKSQPTGDHYGKKEHDDAAPYEERLEAYLNTLTREERESFFSDALVLPERRSEIWMDQADLGEQLVNRFSWAIPNNRALRILRKFSPLIEIGCGRNAYWARRMHQAGIDVVAFDINPSSGGTIDQHQHRAVTSNTSVNAHHFPVQRGGPSVLREVAHSDRTLFLCYPDEISLEEGGGVYVDGFDEPMSMGSACLEYFEGDYVIHVGELYGSTISVDQAPWGRSSSPLFQERLAGEFHCLLKVSLPNWLHVRDTLSVWKRSKTCIMIFQSDTNEQEDEEVEYKYIPPHELLPVDTAAPCLQHLLGNVCSEESTRGKDLGNLDLVPNSEAEKEGFDCEW